jgi:hypothetical protein
MGRVRAIWLTALWLLGLGCCLWMEWVRYRVSSDANALQESGIKWSVEFLFDTPMFLPLFLVWPLCYCLTSGLIVHRIDLVRYWTSAWAKACTSTPVPPSRTPSDAIGSRWPQVRDWLISLAIGVLSVTMSWQAGRTLENLPPAYHDEYSYLFQAQTLIEGRFSYASHPEVAPIFDQMHVVNQGRFASRYYLGTGAWLAPWTAIGHPVWGQWIAGALTAMLVFWTARELGGTGVGVIAGCLTAFSPGLVLFSNLLLAHHPTLLGLAIFLHGFTVWLTRKSSLSLFEGGCGLAFAMLCRPMTAAGAALPFGIGFAVWLLTDRQLSSRSRLLAAAMLGLPLVAGWTVMAAYNHDITGSWTQSPYQLYTDVYTPRHVCGFNNVVRGEAALGDRQLPLVSRNYDAWAENLTAAMSVQNVGQRLLASLRWSLGLIPLLWIILASRGLPTGPDRDKNRASGWNLIALGIISLHAVHIPYWFDGIMHWHYVFESSILWLMLAARGIAGLVVRFDAAKKPWMIVWTGGLLLTAVTTNYLSCPPYWETRLASGLVELRYPKRIYGDFRRRIALEIKHKPALLLVTPDLADRHMDFVTNEPSLTAPVLIGRWVETEVPLEKIKHAFPDRHIYFYDAKSRRLSD